MNDEYGVKLLGTPGQPPPAAIYFEAVDDDHALETMATAWERGEVLALFHYPHGRRGGTQRKVWPHLIA
jgi:hypothetical protein